MDQILYTAEQIILESKNIIQKSRNKNNKLINFIFNQNNYLEFINILSQDITEFTNQHNIISFIQYISPDPGIRKSSSESDLLLSKYSMELNLNLDLYNQIIKAYNYIKNLDYPEELKFLEKIKLIYERHGILLNLKNRQDLLNIKQNIAKLENKIELFLSSPCDKPPGLSKLEFPDINRLNYNIYLKYISNPETRKKIEIYYSEKNSEIIPDLIQLVICRDKLAKLLNYKSYYDYKSELYMVKSPEKITNFLTELLNKLDYQYKRELDSLVKLKSQSENNPNINSWDIPYYIHLWKSEYGLSENYIRDYFELNKTIQNIINIYEKLFDIKFINSKKKLWANQVEFYNIEYNNQIIGGLYLDLISRPGKYKLTRCFCLKPGINSEPALVAILASYNINNSEYLLNFSDLVSLFHEFGHLIHHIFGQTKYIIFSGIQVEPDFLETPAYLLELLCYEKNIIKLLSSHKKTGEKLPDNIIDKLIKIKNLDIGLNYKKNILLALFDQFIYLSPEFIKNLNINTNPLNKLYIKLFSEIMVDKSKNNKYQIKINSQINIPVELINSLLKTDYYSYTWSKILASDLFNQKIKNSELNSNIGSDLVENILKFGGTKPAVDMIQNYIHRKPNIIPELNSEYSFFLTSDNNINTESDTEVSNQFMEIDENYKQI